MARFIAGFMARFMARFIDGFIAKLSSWGSWLSSWPHSSVCLQVPCFKRRNHYWSCQANIKTSDLWKGLAVSTGNLFAPLNFAEGRKHLIWGRSFSNTKPRNGKEFPQSTGLISQSLRWFTLEMSQGGGGIRRANSPSSRWEKMPTWRSETRWPFRNPAALSKLILDAAALFFSFVSGILYSEGNPASSDTANGRAHWQIFLEGTFFKNTYTVCPRNSTSGRLSWGVRTEVTMSQ